MGTGIKRKFPVLKRNILKIEARYYNLTIAFGAYTYLMELLSDGLGSILHALYGGHNQQLLNM